MRINAYLSNAMTLEKKANSHALHDKNDHFFDLLQAIDKDLRLDDKNATHVVLVFYKYLIIN